MSPYETNLAILPLSHYINKLDEALTAWKHIVDEYPILASEYLVNSDWDILLSG